MFRCICFFFSSRRRHTRCSRDWSSDVCSSDLKSLEGLGRDELLGLRGQDRRHFVSGLDEEPRELARLVGRDAAGYTKEDFGHTYIVPWRFQQSGLFTVFSYMSTRARVATVMAALLLIIWLMALVVHGPAR